MTELPDIPTPPRRILLATDLSSRGDRALDRAWQLARTWQASLHLVHVIETAPPPLPAGVDPAAYLRQFPDSRDEALRIIERHIDVDAMGVTVHIEEHASPASAILDLVEREDFDLLVLGEARPRLIGPIVEGTIEEIVRRSPVSVLLVRDRPRRPYRHLLVGTDFTDEAQQALVLAAHLFGDASITLMHAFSMPYASLLEGAQGTEDWTLRRQEKLREHVASAPLAEERRDSIRTVVETGPPGAMLRRYVLEKQADLTVIGAHPRGLVFDAVVGNSRRIVHAIPGDILMVRAVRPPAPPRH